MDDHPLEGHQEPETPVRPPTDPAMQDGPNQNEINWAIFAHLSGLAGYVIPFGGIIGPLVIWLTQRETLPFAGREALKALNFNITMAIAAVVVIILAIITCGIGAIFMLVLGIVHLILVIIAAITVGRGEPYVYPFTLELVN